MKQSCWTAKKVRLQQFFGGFAAYVFCYKAPHYQLTSRVSYKYLAGIDPDGQTV